jgi:hypothetical protein
VVRLQKRAHNPLLIAAGFLKDRSLREAARDSRLATYRAAMVRKYRHAAGYPWLPVEPDPPEPE